MYVAWFRSLVSLMFEMRCQVKMICLEDLSDVNNYQICWNIRKTAPKRIALKNKSHVRTYFARPNIQAVWIKSGENPIQDLNSVGTLNPHRLNIWS